jgi:hypothetical protein
VAELVCLSACPLPCGVLGDQTVVRADAGRVDLDARLFGDASRLREGTRRCGGADATQSPTGRNAEIKASRKAVYEPRRSGPGIMSASAYQRAT